MPCRHPHPPPKCVGKRKMFFEKYKQITGDADSREVEAKL